jgi:hypothetical protein
LLQLVVEQVATLGNEGQKQDGKRDQTSELQPEERWRQLSEQEQS